MNYTENYHLPQWVESDRIMMTDFNQAMENIDAGIAATAYAVGEYTGDGKNMTDGGQLIRLGFHPRFVIVTRGWTSPNNPASTFMAVGEKTASDVEKYIALEDDGFRVGLNGTAYFKLNTADTVYTYMALR